MSGGSSELPEEAYALALATLPSVGPVRLAQLLASRPPSAAWFEVTATSNGDVVDVGSIWHRHVEHGIHVLVRGFPSYPKRLAEDPRGPALVLCLGDPAVLDAGATAALVGTRSPTRYGIGVAAQLGAELASAGVSVVSGLALGIDGAAHEGACGAGAAPIGVVAGGLDEPSPRHHARLWARVAEQGVILSQWPAGARSEKWRFPVRNRLLAALSDVVVVVESRHHGGSRHTVEAALERGIPVGAVPGSIRSATSEGTNALLADGAFPVCSSGDVLLALSLQGASLPVDRRQSGLQQQLQGGATTGPDRTVYEALSSDPASLEELARVTGLELPALCGSLERLAQRSLAQDVGGWWVRG